MKYWIKRIILKSGELVTERELLLTEKFFEGTPPAVGDVLSVRCRGREFSAKVIWGHWPGRDCAEDVIVSSRVQET